MDDGFLPWEAASQWLVIVVLASCVCAMAGLMAFGVAPVKPACASMAAHWKDR